MKVIGINGSPRKGNTYTMLKTVLSAASECRVETELLNLADYEIKSCLGHPKDFCEQGCPQEDDFKELSKKLLEADCIIIGSPTYVGDVSGLLKNFLDRCVHLRRIGFTLRNKVGAGLAVGAHIGGGQEFVLRTIHVFFLKQDMLVVSQGAPYSHSGVIAIAREPFEVEKEEVIMAECKNLGNRVVEVLRMLKSSKAGI